MATIIANIGSSDQTIDSTTPGYEPGDTTIQVQAIGNNTLTVDGIDANLNFGLLGAGAVGDARIAAVNGANVAITQPTVGLAVGSSLTYSVGDSSSISVTPSILGVGVVAPPVAVEFAGTGTGSFAYGANPALGDTALTVDGFSTGDSLNVVGSGFDSFTYDAATQTGSLVYRGTIPPLGIPGGTVTYTIRNLDPAIGTQIAADPSAFIEADGSLVAPVCFVRGTLIETPEGPVAIERLRPGDRVVGSTGLREVKWIGWRNYGQNALRTPEQKANAAPVRIRAGALAEGMPSRDLMVSPWHHLFVDGVLVRANQLVNGLSIVQEVEARTVSYYHVELDRFDVVLAHGVLSESWADGGNRDFFSNADVPLLRPEDSRRRRASRPGFEVLRDETRLRAMRERLRARAVETSPCVEAELTRAS